MPFILGAFKHFGKQFQRVPRAQGDNTKLSRNPLWQGKFNRCGASCTHRGLPQHPTPSSFPRSQITLSAVLWLLSDEALGAGKQNQSRSQAKPCHRADTGPALTPARGSRRRLLRSAHGQKGSAEIFLALTLQNKKQLQAIVCFLSIFSLLVSFLRSFPGEPGKKGCFRRRGLRALAGDIPATTWGCAWRPAGSQSSCTELFSFPEHSRGGGVSHSEENPPPFLLCLRMQLQVEALR